MWSVGDGEYLWYKVLKVVDRGSETRPEVVENLNKLT